MFEKRTFLYRLLCLADHQLNHQSALQLKRHKSVIFRFVTNDIIQKYCLPMKFAFDTQKFDICIAITENEVEHLMGVYLHKFS